MTPKDTYAASAVQMFMDANDLTLEDAILEAGNRIRGAGRCFAKDVDLARIPVQFVGMDPDAGLVRGDRSKIREAKRILNDAKADLDRMTYWDSIQKAAMAMLADEKVYTA